MNKELDKCNKKSLKIIPMMMKNLRRALLSLTIVFCAMGAWAVPCVTPGDPFGCEIDTPLDTHVWVLIAATLILSVYVFMKRKQSLSVPK
jgi:hypothetical protein